MKECHLITLELLLLNCCFKVPLRFSSKIEVFTNREMNLSAITDNFVLGHLCLYSGWSYNIWFFFGNLRAFDEFLDQIK